MARKTVDVDWLKAKVNYFLEHSHEMGLSPDKRLGAAAVLELVLHETDNYKGFNYINGWTPGVDESRRRYF